jgi:hypothetical protein
MNMAAQRVHGGRADFKPVRLTSFLKDDGVELSDIRSPTMARRSCSCGAPPRTAKDGWRIRRESGGADRTIGRRKRTAARRGSSAKDDAELSPTDVGRFAKDGQIYSYRSG